MNKIIKYNNEETLKESINNNSVFKKKFSLNNNKFFYNNNSFNNKFNSNSKTRISVLKNINIQRRNKIIELKTSIKLPTIKYKFDNKNQNEYSYSKLNKYEIFDLNESIINNKPKKIKNNGLKIITGNSPYPIYSKFISCLKSI